MKSFTRIKIIHGIEYLYEITPYYDSQTKTIRQRSKYLGKNKEGKAVRVRQHIPVHALCYGEFLPVVAVIEELRIKETVEKHLERHEVEAIVAIVLNRATYPLALQHLASWYEGTYLYREGESVSLSSQWISRLLDKIGRSSLPLVLSEQLLRQLGTTSTFVYDITSLSSYTKAIEMLEYGYNRDEDGLPQINMSLIVDRELGIPVMYDLYPGSIVDVSTLVNTLTKLKGYGIQNCVLVLDRGFFSIANIRDLERSEVSYVIPASYTIKCVRVALSALQRKLTDPNLMKMYKGKPLFVSDVQVKIGTDMVQGYCYYIPKRQKEEQEGFYKRLYDIKKAIESLSPARGRRLRQRIDAVAARYKQYLTVTVDKDTIQVSIKKNAVSQHVNRMGKFIILYKGKMDWEECLSTYRSKDIVEKGFDILKNDLQVYTPNVRKEATLRGLLFLCFIGLIVRMRLMKKMQESGLSEKYSITGLLTELRKLKIIELTDGKRMRTERTKKQKEILACLNLCA